MKSRRKQAGFTLVEMAASLVALGGLMYVLTSTLMSSQKTSRGTASTFDTTEKTRRILRRISDEVRSASRLGEDTNSNASLDSDEDLNDNNRLERDWNTTATSVTFNRFQPNGTYSLPQTYRLVGTDLIRLQRLTNGEDRRSVVAHDVTGFAVSESAGTVTVEVTVRSMDGETSYSESVSVNLRN